MEGEEVSPEVLDLVERRLAVIRKGWQQQALEKISEAKAQGFAEGKCAVASAHSSAHALEDAEARGFDRGRRQTEDEARKWKALAEAYMPTAADRGVSTGKPTLLVKYVMEQVYREAKREFPALSTSEPGLSVGVEAAAANAAVVKRIKQVLIASNEVLMSKLPSLLISSSAASTTTSSSSSSSSSSSELTAPNRQATRSPFKLCLQCSIAPSLAYLADVLISESLEHSRAKPFFGLAGDSTFSTYVISVQILLVDSISGRIQRNVNPICHSQERRHSEFQALFRDLKKEFPRAIIPPVPTVMAATLGGTTGPGTQENASEKLIFGGKAEQRRRVLRLWLQWIYNHGQLQRSPSLCSFVSGGVGLKTDRDDQSKACFRSVSESEQRVALLSPLQPPREVFSSLQFARELAQRDIQTIQRNVTRVDMDYMQLSDAFKRLRQEYEESSKQFYGAGHACNVMSSIEEKNNSGFESIAWKGLNYTLSGIAPYHIACAQSLNSCGVELITLLCSSLSSTRAIIDSAKTSLVAQGLDESEKFSIAAGVAKEWDANRRIRTSLMLEQFSKLCSEMAAAHANSKAMWEKSKPTLELFDHIADDSFQQESELRRLMNEEMGGLGNAFNSLQDAFNEKQGMQEKFVKITNALRGINSEAGKLGGSSGNRDYVRESNAHKAILKRPILPPGTRKEPTPAPLNADIKQQTLAVKPRRRLSSGVFDDECHFLAEDGKSCYRKEEDDENNVTPGFGCSWDCYEDDDENSNDPRVRRSSSTIMFSEEKLPGGEYDKLSAPPPPPPPPKKASFGWSDIFGRGFTAAAVHRDELEQEGNSFSHGDGGGDASICNQNCDEYNLEEDTPMNRALRLREEEYARKREQEERNHQPAYSADTGDSIWERRSRRPPHSSGPRRPKINQAQLSGIYVPSPQPAPSLRSVPGTFTENSLAEKVPVSIKCQQPQPSEDSILNQRQQSEGTLNQDGHKVARFTEDLPPILSAKKAVGGEGEKEQALPEGWEAVQTQDGSVYYFHKTTRVSRWDFPSAQVQTALEERLRQSQKQQVEAVQRRRMERDNARRVQEEQAQTSQTFQAAVQLRVIAWKHFPGSRKPRPFHELLNTLHTVADGVVSAGDIVKSPLTETSNPAEIKKAFFAAAKYLHPDKLTPNIPLEQRLMAEAAFIILSEYWETERSKS